MNKKERIKKDAAAIEGIITNYSGAKAAHFGFIAHATGERMFWAGGNVAVTGICLSEGIADLIRNTPGLGEEFIDKVAETTKEILKMKGPVQ